MDKLFVNVGRNLNLSIRRLSSFNNNRTKSGIISILNNDDLNIWSENNWSEFGRLFNKSVEFPLPGQIGVILEDSIKNSQNFNQATSNKSSASKQLNDKKQTLENLNYLLNKPLPQENHILKLREAAGGLFYQDKMEQSNENIYSNKNIFALKAFKCPKSLVKDFEAYFRSQFSNENEALTILTVSFKTKNDMATWSSEVESEREALIKNFVDTALDLCMIFKKEGHWADFIDPSSGRPYNSPYSHATFYETDERYHQLGFEILDYGCCKVISHHKWGTKTYVGCLLTTAGVESKIVNDLTKKFNA